MLQRATHILSDPKARPYVWGIGFHWYETWAKGQPMHRNVAAVHAAAQGHAPLDPRVARALLPRPILFMSTARGNSADEIARMRELLDILEGMGLASYVRFDLGVVRGLAYYTGVVFEAFDQKGDFRAIAGGGRVHERFAFRQLVGQVGLELSP